MKMQKSVFSRKGDFFKVILLHLSVDVGVQSLHEKEPQESVPIGVFGRNNLRF
jgi:hypothetical protein